MKAVQGFDIWIHKDAEDADEIMPTTHFGPPVKVGPEPGGFIRYHLPALPGNRLYLIAEKEVVHRNVQWDRWYFVDGPKTWGDPVLIHHIGYDDEPCRVCEFEILGGVTIPDWVLLSLLEQLGVKPEPEIQ